MKRAKSIFKTLLILFIFSLGTYYFLAFPSQVGGNPTFPLKGNQIVLSEKVSYLFTSPKLGDIVTFKSASTGSDIDYIGYISNINKGANIYKVKVTKYGEPHEILKSQITGRVYYSNVLKKLPSELPVNFLLPDGYTVLSYTFNEPIENIYFKNDYRYTVNILAPSENIYELQFARSEPETRYTPTKSPYNTCPPEKDTYEYPSSCIKTEENISLTRFVYFDTPECSPYIGVLYTSVLPTYTSKYKYFEVRSSLTESSEFIISKYPDFCITDDVSQPLSEITEVVKEAQKYTQNSLPTNDQIKLKEINTIVSSLQLKI